MKTIFIITACLFLGIHSYCQSDTTLPIRIELKLLKSDTLTFSKSGWAEAIKRGTYEVATDSIKLKTFDIEISIKNTSQDSIAIWLMTCSWNDGFEVNNDYIHIQGWGCDANFPTPYKFKGGETKTFKATLEKSIKFDYPCRGCVYGYQVLTTKLGLIVTDVRYTPKLNISTQNVFDPVDRSKWRIVWSNPLYLFGKQFEPKPIPVYKN